jgi:acetylornithine deacetylase/succinyl-diaminopimelate desuccinylase-like protein
MRYPAKSARRRVTVFIATLALSGSANPQVAPTPADEVSIKLASEIFQQLIEINTTDSVGSTTIAADAMAKRLRDAGFPADDVVVMGPDPRKGNVVARLHGTGAHKPGAATGARIRSSSSRRTAITTHAAPRT